MLHNDAPYFFVSIKSYIAPEILDLIAKYYMAGYLAELAHASLC